jgi:hypothetical protein
VVLYATTAAAASASRETRWPAQPKLAGNGDGPPPRLRRYAGAAFALRDLAAPEFVFAERELLVVSAEAVDEPPLNHHTASLARCKPSHPSRLDIGVRAEGRQPPRSHGGHT